MATDIFSELRKIRNELAHSRRVIDSEIWSERIEKLALRIPREELPAFTRSLLPALSSYGGQYQVPPLVLQSFKKLLENRSAKTVCDPWAGLGEVLASVCGVLHPSKAFALTQNASEYSVGRVLVPEVEWKLGNPVSTIHQLPDPIDVLASILPFGAQAPEPLVLAAEHGEVTLRADLGGLILAAAATRLSQDGLGLFVVPTAFFFTRRSVRRDLPSLGIGLEAAFHLPAGTFAPYTNVSSYLLVVARRPSTRMFVAELSPDPKTNDAIIGNFTQGREGGTVELGRFVDPSSFLSFGSLRFRDRFAEAAAKFQAPAIPLGDLTTEINLGRTGDGFAFPPAQNAIYIPLIGSSDVVESPDDMTLKKQNYAQLVVNPMKSNASFVARFLNSELGKDIREGSKGGAFIPKLTKQTLQSLTVLVPDLATQRAMLEVEASIASEQNILSALQGELNAFQRELWSNPRSATTVNQSVASLSKRLSGTLREHAEATLDQWCESLPFPLASICRAWQATPSDDFKTKQEHLLHFFEAMAEFLSIIFLSAFASNEEMFVPHRQKLAETMKEQNLNITRATFGTWKIIVEYLGKQTRLLLTGDRDTRTSCGELFKDLSLELPQVISRKELAAVVSTTNKMRNDWSGHGGIVSQDEAKLRNQQLTGQLQKLRDIFAEVWGSTQLVHALHCRPRRGVFENEVSILMGSNSEFVKETRSMSTWLDVESLYLYHREGGQVLRLLPLLQMGPFPQSAKGACYFFNRVERDGSARFVSYHFKDRPELTGKFDQALEAIKMLAEG